MWPGIDLLMIGELDRLTSRPWFMRYVFADPEMAHAQSLGPGRRREFLAGRFAAKEAVLKVLGIGMFNGVPPRDIWLLHTDLGRPTVDLHDAALRAASRNRISKVTVSITHKGDLVAAVAVGW
jgi:holo-[acyl-carrier protein] synthase